MASDAVTFIRVLGLEEVDLHGGSLGGMIAQVIAQKEVALVRKLILTGTAPAGGKGIKPVVLVAQLDSLRGLLSRQDPKQFLFFTRSANGKRAGKAFLARLKERTNDRDKAIAPKSYLAQLKACYRWGAEKPTTSPPSANRSCSPTATTIGCCRHRTRSTWPNDCRTTKWSSTPTRATATSSVPDQFVPMALEFLDR